MDIDEKDGDDSSQVKILHDLFYELSKFLENGIWREHDEMLSHASNILTNTIIDIRDAHLKK